jgi:hypothetical protein
MRLLNRVTNHRKTRKIEVRYDTERRTIEKAEHLLKTAHLLEDLT